MARQRVLGLGDIDIFKTALEGASGNVGGIPVSNVGAGNDAFGRLRISSPLTLFDSKQIVDSGSIFFDDQEVSGGSTTSVYSQNRASTIMGVGNLAAGNRVRQTRQRFNYQPAKSQLIFCTFVLGEESTGITRRVGYFDDDNGVFLEQDDTGYYFVIRSNVSGTPLDTRVGSADWNLRSEKFATQDFTKSQILIIDFEWLGVGSVRFGFVIDGIIYYYHSFYNANNLDSVYMSTPNLPIRYEIDNDGTGASAELEQICSSVISEGGLQTTGISHSISRGSSTASINANNVWFPVLSLRLKDTHKGISILPTNVSEILVANVIYEIGTFINPVVAGVDAASWVALADSAIEYDISRDSTNTLTNGLLIFSALREQTNQSSVIPIPVDNLLKLGEKIDGTKDELVIAIRKYTGSNTTAYAQLGWRELV